MTEVAKVSGHCGVQVSQIHAAAMVKLRASLKHLREGAEVYQAFAGALRTPERHQPKDGSMMASTGSDKTMNMVRRTEQHTKPRTIHSCNFRYAGGYRRECTCADCLA